MPADVKKTPYFKNWTAPAGKNETEKKQTEKKHTDFEFLIQLCFLNRISN